jgi:hypothetical protein
MNPDTEDRQNPAVQFPLPPEQPRRQCQAELVAVTLAVADRANVPDQATDSEQPGGRVSAKNTLEFHFISLMVATSHASIDSLDRSETPLMNPAEATAI